MNEDSKCLSWIWSSRSILVESYNWLPERFFFLFKQYLSPACLISPYSPRNPPPKNEFPRKASFGWEGVEGEKIISFWTNWIWDEFEASKWRCWVGSWICESEIKMWHFGYRDGKWRLALGGDHLGNKQRKEDWSWRLMSPFSQQTCFIWPV